MNGIVYYILAAISWAFIVFAMKRLKNPEEQFVPKKFGRTLVIGIVVGTVAWYRGLPLQSQTAFEQLANSTIVIAVVDQVWKGIWGFYLRIAKD